MKIFLTPDEAGGGLPPENQPENTPPPADPPTPAAPTAPPTAPPAAIVVAQGKTEREMELERQLEAAQREKRAVEFRAAELERDRENLLSAGRVQRPKKTVPLPTLLHEEED
jgi:hypothetical protein